MTLVWWFLLASCSEYGVVEHKDAVGGDDSATGSGDDTGTAPSCDDFEAPLAESVATDEACLAEPDVGTFTPEVEWRWEENETYEGYHQVMSAPAVGNFTDDDGDGDIDEDDIPDIVFMTFTSSSHSGSGVLNVISGDGSGQHWAVFEPEGHAMRGSGGVALGDLDGDGDPEVCATGSTIAVVCLDHEGNFLWAAGEETSRSGVPSIADMDADGTAEVIFGRQVFDAEGNLLGIGEHGVGGAFAVSFAVDFDDDGVLEVVVGNAVHEMDGTALWSDEGYDGYPAVADLDGDGEPEHIRSGNGEITLTDTDGTWMWTTALPGDSGGGPPTVADFDGDGEPEIGVAGMSTYTMLENDGTVVWWNSTDDSSSAKTGSSVFDFEGDGVAEVIYADENSLFVYSGPSGEILLQVDEHNSATVLEYPLVADVDLDGSTEIVLASNNYGNDTSGWTGITVIGDADESWAPARPVWNQHAYHITNVENDNAIPEIQRRNWLSWNNFRSGGTDQGPAHWMADLAPGDPTTCTDECSADRVLLWLPVGNSGLADAASFTVRFLDDEGATVTEESVTVLPSTESTVLGAIALSSDQWGPRLSVQVDADEDIEECDETNNEIDLGGWPCE